MSGEIDHIDLAPPPASTPPESGPAATGIPRRKRNRRQRLLIEWGTIAALAVILAVVVRTFVFQAYYIPSGSMLPTLGIGDRILLDKLFFSPSKVHTGDIIVFSRPPAAICGIGEKDLVKRVIGTPGETLSSRGNTVYIDGRPMAQPYLPTGAALGPPITTQTIYGETLPRVIPPGEFFVMGDNRTNSCDSRYWGYVSANEIVGKVVLDWWHNNHPAFHIF